MDPSHSGRREQNPALESFLSDKRRNVQPVNVNLESKAVSTNPQSYWAMQDKDSKEPQLSFRGVEAGRYSARINANDPWYVQSATCGSTDLLREDLVVSGQSPIEVVLRDDGASVNGTVRSKDRPAAGMILLIRDGAPRQTKTGFVGAGGEFSMTALAPGNYSLLAFDRTDNLEYSDTAVLSKYLPRATRVTLQPNQNLDTTVELIEMGK
jgi:hypothetical protein